MKKTKSKVINDTESSEDLSEISSFKKKQSKLLSKSSNFSVRKADASFMKQFQGGSYTSLEYLK